MTTYYMNRDVLLSYENGVWVDREEYILPDAVIDLWQSDYNGYVSVDDSGVIVRTPIEQMTAYDTEVNWYAF